MLVTSLQIPSIGLVNFSQSRRARHLRITIKPDKTVTVAIPRNGSLDDAKKFLLSKTSWIQKHLCRLSRCDFRHLPALDIDIKKAKFDLYDRLNYFSKIYNFPYNRVFFRRQRTKWGSCSGKNNINLNINLARLPQHLQDYVLIHELVHTKHKNHGVGFWATLNKLVANAKDLRKEMKKYRLSLH